MSKEHPILFSGPMIQALLEGRKTLTRRIVNPKTPEDFALMVNMNAGINVQQQIDELIRCSSPFGQVGDALWVRENFRVNSWSPEEFEMTFRYEADKAISNQIVIENEDMYNRLWEQSCEDLIKAGYEIDPDENFSNYDVDKLRLRPSIHMPRSVSRLQLENTNIHIERLQDISEDDAIAEGIDKNISGDGRLVYKNYFEDATSWHRHPQDSYRTLWQTLHGIESWYVNPWVWVLGLKKI